MTQAESPYGRNASTLESGSVPSIIVVGPSGGGKTTFLQGLLRGKANPDTYGSWRVKYGAEADLAEQLMDNIDENHFPPQTDNVTKETWTITGTWPKTEARSLFGWRIQVRGGVEEQFDLRVSDVPGGAMIKPGEKAELLPAIIEADGIVLLIDPIRMMDTTQSEVPRPAGTGATVSTYRHLHRLLRALDNKLITDKGGKLPHALSICVAKLDHPDVFALASGLHLIDGPDGAAVPGVPAGDKSRQLFEYLCNNSVDPNDAEIPGLIDTYFDRVVYHTVSSIGLYYDPARGFNAENVVNVKTDEGKREILRYRPMEVWETLLDMYLLLAGDVQ